MRTTAKIRTFRFWAIPFEGGRRPLKLTVRTVGRVAALWILHQTEDVPIRAYLTSFRGGR